MGKDETGWTVGHWVSPKHRSFRALNEVIWLHEVCYFYIEPRHTEEQSISKDLGQ